MEATYIGFNMWVKAVQKAGTTDVDKVEQAMIGVKSANLTGGMAVMNANHHLSKPVLIGEIQNDGQFEIVWETDGLIVIAIHPGWIRSDMGGPNADISPQESSEGIIRVIDSLTMDENGQFFTWTGDSYPW